MKLRALLDRWFPRPTRVLEISLLVSVLVHAVLLSVRLVPELRLDRLFQIDQLEIILVNALSNAKAPDQAQALAQTHLQGGGEAEEGRSKSPLARSARTQTGKEDQGQSEQKLQQLRVQQQQFIAQIRNELDRMPVPLPGQAATPADRQRQLMLKQLAELEKRIQIENAKPRTRFVGPSTREVAYAQYYDAVRNRIETHGTRNFPTVNGRKLYGALTMIITIDVRGRILRIEVAQSSGQPALDRLAMAIVQHSGPFAPFDARLKRHADQLALVSRFNFTREGQLNTQVAKP